MFDEGNSFELNSKQHVISVFLVTLTVSIHFHSHNTLFTFLKPAWKVFPFLVNFLLKFKTCGFTLNDCDREPSPHMVVERKEYTKERNRRTFLCEFTCQKRKIYFSCFDKTQKQELVGKKTAGFTCGNKNNVYVSCLASFWRQPVIKMWNIFDFFY